MIVSVIVPARNEAAHVDACVRSVLRQSVAPGVELEVIVADGRSTDGTADVARAAGAIVVDNPAGGISAGLNQALAAARGVAIVRFDAHSEMPDGYLAACLKALDEEDNVATVGGWMHAQGHGPWARAIARALESPFGVGHPLKWRPPKGAQRRDVEHVPFGCYPAERLRAVGGWRDDIVANEDFELDHRLRKAGGRVVYDPSIRIVYRPRESLRGLAAQYWRYGRAKAAVAVDAPSSIQPRQLAPPLLLGALALAVAPTPARKPARRAAVAYALVVSAAAGRSGGGWRTAAAMLTMHLCWGAALVTGVGRELARRR